MSLLQVLVLIPSLYFLQNDYSILLFSISMDSIFSSINFINLFITNDNQLSRKKFMKDLNKLYDISLVNRYLYYLTLQIIYFITCNLFWKKSLPVLYYLLVITICPVIMNYIVRNYLLNIVEIINKEEKRFFRYILCKQISNVINTISVLCIEKDPELNYTELLFLIDDYNVVYKLVITFLKNFLIISAIHYAKINTKKVYGNILSYLYTYQTGNVIETIDLKGAKQRFINIIEERSWKKLLNADTLQSIIYIYTLQEPNRENFLDIYITKFNYMLLKMISIWSIGNFINKIYIIPLLSIFLAIYKKPFNNILEQKNTIIFRLMVLIVSFLTKNNYFVISFLCEFGYFILINKIVFISIQYIYDRIKRLLNICISYNEYNYMLISMLVSIGLIDIIFIEPKFIHYFIDCSVMIVYFRNKRKSVVITMYMFFGYFSNYNILHQLYIVMVIYFYFNIYYYYLNNKNIAISVLANKLHPSVVESYYRRNGDVNDDEIGTDVNIDDFEYIHKLIEPNAPIVYDDDEEFISGSNVKIYHKMNIIDNY